MGSLQNFASPTLILLIRCDIFICAWKLSLYSAFLFKVLPCFKTSKLFVLKQKNVCFLFSPDTPVIYSAPPQTQLSPLSVTRRGQHFKHYGQTPPIYQPPSYSTSLFFHVVPKENFHFLFLLTDPRISMRDLIRNLLVSSELGISPPALLPFFSPGTATVL